jgi:hypothetical protein
LVHRGQLEEKVPQIDADPRFFLEKGAEIEPDAHFL